MIRDVGYQRVALVGHSMGGLLCQSAIKSLIDSRTRDLDGTIAARKVAGLFLMATPQAGSLRVPRVFSFLTKDSRVLAAHSAFVSGIQERFSDMVQISSSGSVSTDKFYIPTFALIATHDIWVDKLSSRLALPRDHTKTVSGTHTSLIKPHFRDDDGYRWFLPRLRLIMSADDYRERLSATNEDSPAIPKLEVVVPAELGGDKIAELLEPIFGLPFETQVRISIENQKGEESAQ